VSAVNGATTVGAGTDVDVARPAAGPTAAALAAEIAQLAGDKKALAIVEIDLRQLVSYADFLIVATGNTERQTKAIHDGIDEGVRAAHRIRPRRVEGLLERHWILMDYLDVVVHIFTPVTREFYRLEALWGEAPVREVNDLDAPPPPDES
jgi:ribosome-associated protein